MRFKDGQRVARIHVYGPADIDYDERYCDMAISMEAGQMALVPWVRVVNKKTGEIEMVNCAKCAAIALASAAEERQ